jgi:hypothetical protein
MPYNRDISKHYRDGGSAMSTTQTASTASLTTLPAGTLVSYHGSIYDWHGLYVTLKTCGCRACLSSGDLRYVLADAGWADPMNHDAELEHVRPQSITVAEDAGRRCVRSTGSCARTRRCRWPASSLRARRSGVKCAQVMNPMKSPRGNDFND